MKLLRPLLVLFFLVSSVLPCLAQPPFSIPMKPGDIEVYVGDRGEKYIRSTTALEKLSGNFNGGDDTVFVYRAFLGLADMQGSGPAFVNERGMFVEQQYYRPEAEQFPVSPPLSDTVCLRTFGYNPDSVLYVVTQRFDTTIFSQRVRAFTITSLNQSPIVQRTIADTFGLVFERRGSATLSLSSAVIDGREYNRDTVRRSYMPMCTSNRYQCRHYSEYTRKWTYTLETVRDTIIGGIQYSAGTSLGTVRETAAGLFQRVDTTDQLLVPSYATLGSLCQVGIVTDTSSVLINGALHKRVETNDYHPELFFTEVWIEGIGRTKYEVRSAFADLNAIDTITYAEICGTIFGTLVGVEESRGSRAPLILLLGNYPNPFNPSTNIPYTLPSEAHVELKVFDLLGREVATLVNDRQAAGRHAVRFEARGLPSGIYFVQLRAGDDFAQTKIMLMR